MFTTAERPFLLQKVVFSAVVNKNFLKPEVQLCNSNERCVAMKSGVSNFGKELGVVHEVLITGRKAGWGKEQWAKFAHDEPLMRSVALVIAGRATIVHNQPVVAKRKRWERQKDTERIRYTQRKYLMYVNLGAPASLPFSGATAHEKNHSDIWVKVELRRSVLYVDDAEVILHLEDGQKNGTSMMGHDLSSALSSRDTLHPNILDALMFNRHFISESWKCDEKGRIRFIVFWNVEFSSADGLRYVRCLYWRGGVWQAGFDWLVIQFGVQYPAVLRAP